MNKAAFLDRDGVLNEDPPHYAHELSDLHLIPNTAKAITLLNENDYLVIIVSNQSGIGRGFYTANKTEDFNNEIQRLLKLKGAHIDKFYYCPHHPHDECTCRKPEPGMLLSAIKEFDIDINNSFMIGDKCSDIAAGKAVGLKTILVSTGHGGKSLKECAMKANLIARDLHSSVEQIVKFNN